MKELWIEEFNRWQDGEEVDPELIPSFEAARESWKRFHQRFSAESQRALDEADEQDCIF